MGSPAPSLPYDWEGLSPDGRRALQDVALPLALGLSLSEIASRRGETRRSLSRRLEELRAELEAQAAPPVCERADRPGVPVTQVAAQLGHSRKSMTLDVYSHVLLGES